MFCFKNNSKKIKRILLTDYYNRHEINEDRICGMGNQLTVENYENCAKFGNINEGILGGKGKGKIKKMSFRNPSDVIAKFKKFGL